MKMQNEYYKTSDICLAAFLLAKSIEFTGINKDSSNRATFLFAHSSKIDSLVSDFSQMQTTVEPISFHAAMKRLKQLLYLNKNEHE
jgi:tmRNA-binding protein